MKGHTQRRSSAHPTGQPPIGQPSIGQRPIGHGRSVGVAALLALVCAALFLRGALIPGNTLAPFPPEVMGIYGRALPEPGGAAAIAGNLAGGDKYHQTLALDRILGDRLRAGEFPRWTRAIGGGVHFTPHLVQSYQPWAWLTAWVDGVHLYGWWFLGHVVILGATAMGLLRRVGVAPLPALVGVVAIGLGFWTQARAQHLMHLTSALPVFFVLSMIWDLFRTNKPALPRFTLLALGFGLSWLGGFPTHSVHLTWLAGFWTLGLWWAQGGSQVGSQGGARRASRWQKVGFVPALWVAAALVVGALLAAPQALATLWASELSSRQMADADYLVTRTLEVDHLLHLLWPDLLHWPRDAFLATPDGGFGARPSLASLVALRGPGTSGANWIEGAFSAGAVGTVLGCLGLAARPRAVAVGLALVAVMGFATAAAWPPFFQFARILPLFAVSDVKRTVFLLAVALPLLAALGAHRLWLKRAPLPFAWLCATLGLGSAVFGFWIQSLAQADFLRAIAWLYTEGDEGQAALVVQQSAALWLPGEAEGNQARLAATFVTTGTALLLSAALLRLQLGALRVIGIGVLLGTELLWVGRGSFVAVESARITEPPAILQPVLDATAVAQRQGLPAPRMITLAKRNDLAASRYLFPNLPAFYGVEDCCTYNPLPPRRMEDFFLAIDAPPAPKPIVAVRRGTGTDWLRRTSALTHPALSVFGVRFVLTAQVLELPGHVDVTPAGVPAPYRLYERTASAPRATFVTDITIANTAADAAEFVRARRTTAQATVLEGVHDTSPVKPPNAGPGAAAAAVEFVELSDERVALTVSAPTSGYLRLADPWDPGWTATVDGDPTPILPADLHLRAVAVPKGEHDVVFQFDGPRVRWPERLGLLALVILAITGIASVVPHMRSTKVDSR